jgi:hypothetical protein
MSFLDGAAKPKTATLNVGKKQIKPGDKPVQTGWGPVINFSGGKKK